MMMMTMMMTMMMMMMMKKVSSCIRVIGLPWVRCSNIPNFVKDIECIEQIKRRATKLVSSPKSQLYVKFAAYW